MDEELSSTQLYYTGKIQPKTGDLDTNGRPLSIYLPDKALVEAVNLAIYLKRPLLVKGEPGCGKTRLARAVAYELGLPYEEWYIKSTSRALDGLYLYDTVGRLRDAQLVSLNQMKNTNDSSSYIRWGPLGRAFQSISRTVVLIDEIDKADIDFPNDLLLELDEQRFMVEETGQEIRAKEVPIVFITSNDEKDLPDAFLRRCLFHYIKFPQREWLIKIVNSHFPDSPQALVDAAVSRFSQLRSEMYEDKGGLGKKVSTSELLDWFRVLRRHPQDEVLIRLGGELPYSSVLLKTWDDHLRYLKQTDLEAEK